MTTKDTCDSGPVLLYDGICGFCNSAVRTIARMDRHGKLRFAALDGDFGSTVVARHPELRGVDSMVFVDNVGRPDEEVTVRSAAALRVVNTLGGPYRVLSVVGLIPAPVRDLLYDGFAHIRYRVFGTEDICPIPAPDVRARFIS